MESWRINWRDGFAPVITTEALEFLREALATDDARLCQGRTTIPAPQLCVQDWPVEGGDFLGVCGVAIHGGWGVAKVGEVEEFFARACFDADQLMGEPAACRWILNWYDDTSRNEMRRELLAEVDRTLAERREREASGPDVIVKGDLSMEPFQPRVESPPARRASKSNWEVIRQFVIQAAGQWCVVGEFPNCTTNDRMKHNGRFHSALKRRSDSQAKGFEVKSATVDGTLKIYARYIAENVKKLAE